MNRIGSSDPRKSMRCMTSDDPILASIRFEVVTHGDRWARTSIIHPKEACFLNLPFYPPNVRVVGSTPVQCWRLVSSLVVHFPSFLSQCCTRQSRRVKMSCTSRASRSPSYFVACPRWTFVSRRVHSLAPSHTDRSIHQQLHAAKPITLYQYHYKKKSANLSDWG